MDIQLHYFSGRGIGEPIRLTLAASDIPFTDHRYSTTDPSWRDKLEKHLPFGQMPALEVDGTFIGQATRARVWPQSWQNFTQKIQ